MPQRTQPRTEVNISKKIRKSIETGLKSETAMLIGVQVKGLNGSLPIDDSIEELAQLAEAAGAEIVGRTTQSLETGRTTYLGKGKLDELLRVRSVVPFDTLIADDELSPTQQHNLERAFHEEVKVIDRTALILDVFARHARTKEGQTQVALAQTEYLLPRLAGQWSHLERLGGGIGTRGPGESQIETDRRLIRRRIQTLKADLQVISKNRAQYRLRRGRNKVPVVSIVGYTNAGKSSLLNALTHANVTVRNQPFSTLDPVTRRLVLPDGTRLLLTDTVGFIQKLPKSLIASFRATLEELNEADILLHVVDISHPNAGEHVDVVEKILDDLGIGGIPRILVFNKADLINREFASTFRDHEQRLTVLTSAITAGGFGGLLDMIQFVLAEQTSFIRQYGARTDSDSPRDPHLKLLDLSG